MRSRVLLALGLAACTDTTLGKLGDPPQVNFVRPADGGIFDPLATVDVCLQVKDEADPADLQILLESDVDGILADSPAAFGACAGGNLGLGVQLSAAEQILSVTVVDPEGASDTASVSLVPILDSAPDCDVTRPTDGLSVIVGDTVEFFAVVDDAETSPSDLLVVWESDVDGTLFDGQPDSVGQISFSKTDLSRGNHLLTLSVTDARSNVERCTTSLVIDACTDDDGDGVTTCDGDCDDTDPEVSPEALEVLDGKDNDCDGEVDEETDLVDDDGDGFSEVEGDCDDTDPTVNPDATEVWYDGVDSDCNESSDYDADYDGQDTDVAGGTDCDDADPTIFAGASETWYDGVDADCSGGSDYDADLDGQDSDAHGGTDCDDGDPGAYLGATDTWYDGVDSDCGGDNDYDADADGYLSDAYGGTDCDDTTASVNPAAAETWYDGLDGNCDGASDYDADGDGYDSDAHSGTDCDDGSASVNPGETENWYDGVDSDCDGASDYDADGDGDESDAYGGLDCDDADATVWTGATELRDGQDNDCDDYCDEGLLSAGDLVINEFLKDPSAVSDTTGEWFEVANVTSTDITLCDGWEVYDDDSDTFLVLDDVYIPAGGVAVFGRSTSTSATGGITVDYNFGTGMQLANGADEIVLFFDDPDGTPFEMSRVEYLDRPTWPDTAGKSISLDPDYQNEVDNDDVSNWCHGTSTYGAGDVGTPGSVNDEC